MVESDGWPQISDAVVDYYGVKKLAYDYIKASQQDFVSMADEISNWGIKVGENQNAEVTSIPVMYNDKELFTFEWNTNVSNGRNHYICGYPAFNLKK